MPINPKQDSPPVVSASVPDWSRETPRSFWDASRQLVLTIRRYQYWCSRKGMIPALMRRLLVIRHHMWSAITGADIPLNCSIGGGVMLPHPNGIVIHPGARIGVNCLIFQQVTIGARSGAELPVIGGHVDIGAGAKILGGVRIGDHASIGANAVVLVDVPNASTAVGMPAKIVKTQAT